MAAGKGSKIGQAFVSLYADDSALHRGLGRARKNLANFGASAMRIGAGMIAASAGAITAPLLAASNMEEVMGKFGVVFGDNADAVKAWGDQYASSVGRSERQVAEFLSNSQDLLVPLGFEDGAATELSKTITGLAVDLASFNNMSDADTFRDMQAALTGSGEVMKKYGVVLSEAAVKQELLNQGLDPKTASNQAKVQARLNIILRGTTAAQGDALRTAGSFANQMKRLRANAENVAVTIGKLFLPAATKVAKALNAVVAPIKEWINNNQGLAQTIASVVMGVGIAGAALFAIGIAASVASIAIGGLMSVMSILAAVVAAVFTPFGIALVALGAAAFMFRDQLMSAFTAVVDYLGPVIQFARETVAGIAAAFQSGGIAAAGEVAMASLEVAWLTGTKRIRQIWAFFTEGLLTTWDTINHAIATGFRTTMQFISGLLGAAVKQVQSVLSTLAQYDPTGIAQQGADALGGLDFSGGAQSFADDQSKADAEFASLRAKRANATAERLKDIDAQIANANARRDAAMRAGAIASDMPTIGAPGLPEPAYEPGGSGIANSSSAAGLGGFNAAIFGGGPVASRKRDRSDDIARNTERTAANLAIVARNLQLEHA